MTAKTTAGRLLRIDEIAGRLRLSESEVRRRIRSGEIKGAQRLGHGRTSPIVMTERALETYVASLPLVSP